MNIIVIYIIIIVCPSNHVHHRHHMVDRWDHSYPVQNSPCGILNDFEVKPKAIKKTKGNKKDLLFCSA